MKYLILTINLCLLGNYLVLAQEGNASGSQTAPPLYDVVSQSPEVASLGQFVESPVNLFHGNPQISIPIYNIQLKSLSIPISLGYNSKGIKVDQLATNVGLGWSLFAGGSITRSIHSDDDWNNPLNFPPDFSEFGGDLNSSLQVLSNPDYFYAQQAAEGNYNIEPDVFFYNFLGRGGKFIRRHNTVDEYVTYPQSALKISPDLDITDEQGIVYKFRAIETSKTSQDPVPNGLVANGSDSRSWFLTDIITPQGEIVKFEYENYRYEYEASQFESYFLTTPGSLSTGCSPRVSQSRRGVNQTQVNGLRIKKITSSAAGGEEGVKVIFNYSALLREDIASRRTGALPQESRALENIQVSYKDEEITEFVFTHDYFRTNSYDPSGNFYDNALASRLKLVSVKELGKAPNVFTYQEGVLPNRLSNAQDDYGYFNGKLGNKTLIPRGSASQDEINRLHELMGDDLADRSMDPEAVKAFILTRHQYPTGGYTQFEYEAKSKSISAASGEEFHVITTSANRFVSVLSSVTPVEVPSDYDAGVLEVNIVRKEQVISPTNIEPLDFSKFVNVKLRNAAGTDVIKIFNKNENNQPFSLPIGAYQIEVTNPSPDLWKVNWSLKGRINSGGNQMIKVSTGGVRVREIAHYEQNETVPRLRSTFTYEDPTNTGIFQYRELRGSFEQDLGDTFGVLGGCQFITLNSSGGSQLSGLAYQSDEGYGKVTKTNINLASGNSEANQVTVYEYVKDISEISANNFRTGLITSYDWARGLPKKTTYKKFENGIYKTLREEINEYYVSPESPGFYDFEDRPETLDFNEEHFPGMRVSLNQPQTISLGNVSAPAIFDIEKYKVVSVWHYLESKTIKEYEAEEVLTTVTDYYYDPVYKQMTGSTTTNSEGEVIEVRMKHPFEYQVAPYTDMVANNILSPAIETKTSNLTDNVILDSRLIEYERNGPFFNPKKEYYLNIGSSLAVNSDAHSTTLPKWTNQFVERRNYNFDQKGLLSTVNTYNQQTRYIWGYDNNHVIAVVNGNEQGDIAYTSFEDRQFGGWNIITENQICENNFLQCSQGKNNLSDILLCQQALEACKTTSLEGFQNGGKTGNTSYRGTIQKSVAAGNYVITLWAKGNGNITVDQVSKNVNSSDWELLEWTVSIPSQTTLHIESQDVSIDELRLSPSTSLMQSFTHYVGKGIASSNDANNSITYYEYDGVARLHQVIDHKGNVVQQYEYNYKNQ